MAEVSETQMCLNTSNKIVSILWEAMNKIANCNESSCERYVAKVDDIACEALAHANLTALDGMFDLEIAKSELGGS